MYKNKLILLLLMTYMFSNIEDWESLYLTHYANSHNNMNDGLKKDSNIIFYKIVKEEIKEYSIRPDKDINVIPDNTDSLQLVKNSIKR